jgi:hypothetical protein
MNRGPVRKMSICERRRCSDSTQKEGSSCKGNLGSNEAAGRFPAGAEPLRQQPVRTTLGVCLCVELHRTDFGFAFGMTG